MKKTLILTLIILLFPIIAFAQNGLVNPNQVAPVTISVEAGEDLSAGDVVSLINSGGTMKAYNNALTVSTSPNGAESVFNAAATTYCSAVALDSTRFLVAFVDSDTYGHAIVGTVSGSSISWGSKSNAFQNNATAAISTCLISTDKVLVAYDANSLGRCVVLSISGTTITVNTPASFWTSGRSTGNSLSKLDTDKIINCFRGSVGANDWGRAVIISISDTTPSAGTPVDFNAAATTYISVSALSSTSAIVAYQDGGNSNYGTAQVLSISGTTITPGTEYVFKEANSVQWATCTALSSTTAVIVYRDSNNPYLAAIFATNAAGTLSYGTELVTTLAGMNAPAITTISSTKVIVACDTYSAPNHTGKSVIINSSGTALTADTAYSTNAAGTYQTGICYLGNNKSVIAYQDDGNSSYGTAVVNQWATTSYASVAGISSGAYSSGSDAVVLISGVSDDQSGLIVGSPYFLQSDFTIGTTPVSLAKYYNSSTATGEIKIGTAKSATELIIGIDYK